MENIKLENWTRRMNEYVNKTAKHLFLDNNKRLFKVIPFKYNDKNMVASIRFDEKYFRMKVEEVEADSTESLFDMKTTFFPQWYKSKSIKNFKLIKEITNTITEYLENEYDGSNLKNAENEAFIKKLVQNEKVFTKKLDKSDNF